MTHAAPTDFEFLYGDWVIEHHKLADQFDPACTEWLEFTTRATAAPILDGFGNQDSTEGTLPDGRRFCGHSLRLFEPATATWRIWWASLASPGLLDEPVEGRFEDGTGVFVGPFEHDGRTLLARFRWLTADPDRPVWEQEFSWDDGRTWGPVNWRMSHHRAEPSTAAPAQSGG